MRETFVIANCNETELLKTMAYHNRNTMGVRVFNAYSLAQEALIRNGIIINDILPQNEESFIIDSFIRDIPYFSSTRFEDSKNLGRALNELRNLITEDESDNIHNSFMDDVFPDKNKAIIDAYDAYKEKLSGRLDRIDVIRKAISECKALDVDFVVFEEINLSPLERKLVDTLSGNNTKVVSIIDFFGADRKEYKDIEYIKAYGNSNEIEDILDYIYGNDIPLDSCLVVVSDENKYGSLLYEYSSKYDIPMTFGNGISILNSNPAKLLKKYEFWDDKGYHGIDALIDMIFSPYFNLNKLYEKLGDNNRYILQENLKQIGSMKISADETENRIRVDEYKKTLNNMPKWYREDYIDFISEELGKGCSYFIGEYSLLRENSIDISALRTICSNIDKYLEYKTDGSYKDILDDIYSKKVCRQISETGKLHVSSIDGAFANMRDYLFIVGLSANNFPGSPKENYLLLDRDLLKYGDDVLTSERIIEEKKKSLYNLVSLSCSLNMKTRLSYSSYGMSELKTENPSSVLFEVFRRHKGIDSTTKQFEENLISTGYFDNRLSLTRNIGSAYNRSEKVLPMNIDKGDIHTVLFTGEKSFSPTNIETYFNCPKQFYLKFVLRLEEPDPDDPFVVINARDLGTLAHSMMEFKANKKISKKEFMSYCNTSFENFLKSRVPMHEKEASKAKEQFISMMSRAYDADPDYEVMAAEEKISVEHPSGIILYGYPDRVEKDEDGNYLIADFKTKRSFEHKSDDIETCMQVVMYAYMIAHDKENPMPISRCEYRYLRYGKSVYCFYNPAMEKQLDEKLKIVNDALDNGYYPCAEDDKACRYCKFADICGKNEEL